MAQTEEEPQVRSRCEGDARQAASLLRPPRAKADYPFQGSPKPLKAPAPNVDKPQAKGKLREWASNAMFCFSSRYTRVSEFLYR